MRLTYNSIFSIFFKQYPYVLKYKINNALITIIYPNYERNNDYDFASELYTGKRNLPKRIREKAKYISFKNALLNTKDINILFNNDEANKKIQYMIIKLSEFDVNFKLENCPIYKEQYYTNTTKLNELTFVEFITNFILYVSRDFHSSLGYKISSDKLDELENYGIEEAPYIFFENNKEYLKKYNRYYNQASANISLTKTILYNKEAIDFYDVYVKPCISSSFNSNNLCDLKLSGSDLSTRNFIMNFGKYTSIIAHGGFGKSMLLKHLFLCDKNLSNDLKADVIPILLHVRSFGNSFYTIEDMLYNEISKYTSIKKEQFLSDMKSGNFLLLFDGLDEIKANNIENFFDDLNDLIERYPYNYYVTSSRPNENSKCLNKFKIIYLNDFDIEQAIEMIMKLPHEENEIKNEFCNKLRNGEFNMHSKIASNPLLLTLMYIIFKNKHKLPRKTYKFYEYAFSVLFLKHDKLKGFINKSFKTGLNPLKFSKYLSEFCFVAISSQIFSFSEIEYLSIFNKTSFSSIIDPDDFLYDLVNNLSFVYHDSDKYHFIHRTFQEYFAAFHCKLLNNEDFTSLINWFNTLKQKEKGEIILSISPIAFEVFDFLFSMDKERVNRIIIKPYLSDCFINTGNINYDYLHFLCGVFKEIFYEHKAVMIPSSELFKIILEKFTNSYQYEFTFISNTDYKDFISTELFNVQFSGNIECWSKEEIEKYIEINNESSREQILKKLNINLDSPTLVKYKIPIKKIIENIDKYNDLITILTDKNFGLWKMYMSIKKIYYSI